MMESLCSFETSTAKLTGFDDLEMPMHEVKFALHDFKGQVVRAMSCRTEFRALG